MSSSLETHTPPLRQGQPCTLDGSDVAVVALSVVITSGCEVRLSTVSNEDELANDDVEDWVGVVTSAVIVLVALEVANVDTELDAGLDSTVEATDGETYCVELTPVSHREPVKPRPH